MPEINAIATDVKIGWNGSTQLLPNGDGGLIVESNDGTDVLKVNTDGGLTQLSSQSPHSYVGLFFGDMSSSYVNKPNFFTRWGNSASVSFSCGRYSAGNSWLGINSTTVLGWGASNDLGANDASLDTTLYRDAANSLALRNDTNEQSFAIYNTYTDSSNYERLRTYWDSNTVYIAAESDGTGSARAIEITSSSAGVNIIGEANARLLVGSGGSRTRVIGNFDPYSSSNYDLGNSAYWRDLRLTRDIQFSSGTKINSNDDGGLTVQQNDGTDVLSVSSGGTITTQVGEAILFGSNSAIQCPAEEQFYFRRGPSGTVRCFVTGSGASRVAVASSMAFAWSSTSSANGTADTLLYRDAANSLALRNDTNAQRLSIYNTYTDSSNYERLGIYWDSNVATISTEAAGTGTSRTLRLQAGSQVITLDTNGAISTPSNTWTQGSRFSVNGSSNVAYFQTASLTDYASVRMAAVQLVERSADPSDPSEGQSAIWQSDGTGSGDDGDIMIKVTAGGVTKTITLVDFSSF